MCKVAYIADTTDWSVKEKVVKDDWEPGKEATYSNTSFHTYEEALACLKYSAISFVVMSGNNIEQAKANLLVKYEEAGRYAVILAKVCDIEERRKRGW